MGQANVVRFRPLRLASANVAAAPTDNLTTPHYSMSPVAPSGLPTTGFIFMLKAPSAGSATAGAGGFTVTIWFVDPVTGRWGSSQSVSVSYGQLFASPDVDAMAGVYFQLGNVSVAGNVDIHFAEQ